jgi:hypothetical protein
LKIRRLPDLDIARIGPMPKDKKRRELEQMKLSHAPYSYNPTRKSSLDILNIQAGPLGLVERAHWDKLEDQIRRNSRSPKEAEANVAVAKSLYGYATENRIEGKRHEFFPLKIGKSESVTYWLGAVLSIAENPCVALIDPRQSKKLTKDGRQFAFSMMHQRIRAADPDFADVELAIIQFDKLKDGTRFVRPHFASGVSLWDFDQLDFMVRETYEIWHEVLEEREAASRRKGSGTGGLFG